MPASAVCPVFLVPPDIDAAALPADVMTLRDLNVTCTHKSCDARASHQSGFRNGVITSSPAKLGRCRRLTPTPRLHRRSGVMGIGRDPHDPSARCAGTSPSRTPRWGGTNYDSPVYDLSGCSICPPNS